MTTPNKITLQEANEQKRTYLREQTCLGLNNLLCHRACAKALRLIPVYLSIHNSAFGQECAGAGRVQIVLIPYCPVCEPTPNIMIVEDPKL